MLSSYWPEQLLELFNLIKEHNRTEVGSKMSFDKSIYTFEEDIFLSGFTPFSQILTKSAHTKTMPSEIAQFQERLMCIELVESSFVRNLKQLRGEQFYNMFSPEIIKTTEDGDINTLILEEAEDNNIDEKILDGEGKICEKLEQGDDDVAGSEVERDVDGSAPKNSDLDNLDDHVSQLMRLKRQLEAKNKAQRIYNNRLIEIMRDIDTKLYIEVRPKYLLPDTNCFIDCLDNFKRIVNEFKHYILIVPLTGKFEILN